MAKKKQTVKAEAPKTIEEMTTEQLALQLNRHYATILQSQQLMRQSEASIQAINKEIEGREQSNVKDE